LVVARKEVAPVLESVLVFLDRWPRTCLAVVGTAFLVAAYFAVFVRVEDSPERWMPHSTLAAWEIFDSHFDVGDTIAVGLHFQRPIRAAEGTVRSADGTHDPDRALLRELRKKIAAVPGLKQVYDASIIAEIEGVSLSELLDPRNAERFALYDRALWDRPEPGRPPLDDRTLLMICELRFLPPSQADELNDLRRVAVREVAQILDVARTDPRWVVAGHGVEFHMASGIVMMHELERRAQSAALLLLPISGLLGLASLWIGFRSWQALAVAICGSLFAMIFVLGYLGMTGGRLGIITVTAPTLMVVVAIATTVHFAAYAAEHPLARDASKAERAARRKHFIHWVGVPCFGSAATTAVGFGMLAFNELAPVRELGQQLAAGTMLAFFGVFFVTQVWPLRQASAGRWLTPDRVHRFSMVFLHRPWQTTLGMSALTVLLVFWAWPRPAGEPLGIRVDANPFGFFTEDQPLTRALQHFAGRGFGMYQLEVVLVPEQKGRAPQGLDPGDDIYQANARRAREFSEKITAHPELGVIRVVSSLSVEDRRQQLLSELTRQAGDRSGMWSLLQKGLRLMLDAELQEQLQRFNDTFAGWSEDKLGQGAWRMTFLCQERDAEVYQQLVALVERELPRDRFACSMTGAVAQIVALSEGLVTAMVYGLGTSLLVMALVCMVLFHSSRLAVVAFPSNAFPLLAVFGLMGLWQIPISSGSAMVASVALGIALNDTIHFLLHYRQLTRDEGRPRDESLSETLLHIGRPMILTSLVHCAGFAIFFLPDLVLRPTGWQVLNGFQPLAHFGLLGSVSMIAALLGDILLLPSLIVLTDRARTQSTAVPATAAETILTKSTR